MPREYDEPAALAAYVCEYCTDLMTDLEEQAVRAIEIRARYGQTKGMLSGFLQEKFPWAFSPQVDELLKQGSEPCRKQICERIMRDHNPPINRCPACQAVVRTPKAKLCLWCGHEWRNS